MLGRLSVGLARKRFVSPSLISGNKALYISNARFGIPLVQPFGVRYKSDIATEVAKISEPLSDVADKATSVLSQVSPDQIGYFQSVGLAKDWIWPEYIFQHTMEYFHVYTGLPWWATIAILAFGTRCLMLPIYLSSSDTAAKMSRIKPEMTEIMERTKKATSKQEIQLAMLERRQLLKQHDIKMLNMAKPLLSVPIFFGFFNALRGMSNVPVAGFTTEGIAWFQNLAVADPYCGLQIITATLYAATFKFFGGETGAVQITPAMKKLFTYMPFIAVPLTMSLPSSICLYFAVNSIFSVIQSNLLKSNSVRKALKLAPLVTAEEQAEINKRMGTDPASASDSILGSLRKKFQDAKDQAERRVAEEERTKKAALIAKMQEESEFIQERKK